VSYRRSRLSERRLHQQQQQTITSHGQRRRRAQWRSLNSRLDTYVASFVAGHRANKPSYPPACQRLSARNAFSNNPCRGECNGLSPSYQPFTENTKLRAASQRQQRKGDQRRHYIARGGVLQAQHGQQLATEAERVVVESDQILATGGRQRAPPTYSKCHVQGHKRTQCRQ
jgi:hypothetical protein